MKKCPECDSEKIIETARAVDSGENFVNLGFTVAVDAHPEAFLFKNTTYSNVKARICGDCGYIRFYATEAQRLWKAYQNQQNIVS